MKWKCKVFGHKFEYDDKDGLKHRKCKRCSFEQWGHPHYVHEGGEVNMYGYVYDESREDYHSQEPWHGVLGCGDPPDNPESINLN